MKLQDFVSCLTEFNGEQRFAIIDADTEWILIVKRIYEWTNPQNGEKIVCVEGSYDDFIESNCSDNKRRID